MKIIFAVDKSRFLYIEQLGKELEKFGIKYFLVDDLSIDEKSLLNNKISRWIQKPKKFVELINNIKPDLIFTERSASHFASLTIDENIPLIIFLRGNIWEELNDPQTVSNSYIKKAQIKFKKNITEKCFTNAKIILPICNYLTEITKEHYPRKKIKTMYQGISLKDWNVTKNKKLNHPCVGLVQNANFWKKSEEMLVLKKVIQEMPNVVFYWAGDGPYRDKIISELGKFQNFKWLGSLKYPNEIRDFLSEIDVYALASGLDMAPHTILEAQLMEKPVVATNVGGIPELIMDNETGFLIEKGNVEKWIEKLSLLINDPELCKRIGSKGKEFTKEKFEWTVIANEFIDILKEEKLFK